jgi:hypothetical protein
MLKINRVKITAIQSNKKQQKEYTDLGNEAKNF